jgi:RND family efflux transporter MFP subunit
VATLLVLVGVLVAVGMLMHRAHVESRQRADLDQRTSVGPRVTVARVDVTPLERAITLPGDLRGFTQVTLYSKVSGYVGALRVERGDHVQRGQVLATIDSPETATDLASARHEWDVSRSNAERAEHLAPSGVVSAQDRDNAVAQRRIAGANFGHAAALRGYATVRAPFDGVVTARYIDPGALVPAATGGPQSAVPIVDVADVDTLRVFVYVSQDAAPFVHPGDPASIWQDELPGRRISAAVTRTTGALEPRTRTMQVEIDIDNRPLGLLPGTFAHVELRIHEPATPVIPDNALVIRDGKTVVATVKDGRVRYVEVDLGYNDGRKVRVVRGLSGGEAIGLDVPVEVQDGDAVQAAEAR